MDYIKPYDDGAWGDYSRYWPYLETVVERFPPGLASFALDEANYNLTDPNSLHDAWMEVFVLQQAAAAPNRWEISLRLFSPRHDRHISLRYTDVSRYELSGRSAQQDVLVHEIRFVRDDVYAHQFLFADGSSMLIEFSGFEHTVELQ
ncbi:MAG: hypothetical protein H6924_12155 [Alphaproteobacteria bacterium]|nr:hypothetical protein [Alphaproteobacteria bacterium]